MFEHKRLIVIKRIRLTIYTSKQDYTVSMHRVSDLRRLSFVRCKSVNRGEWMPPSNLSNYHLEKMHSTKNKTFLADPSSRVS